jgi:hypothetical protein
VHIYIATLREALKLYGITVRLRSDSKHADRWSEPLN